MNRMAETLQCTGIPISTNQLARNKLLSSHPIALTYAGPIFPLDRNTYTTPFQSPYKSKPTNGPKVKGFYVTGVDSRVHACSIL